MFRQSMGKEAENQACLYLIKQGLRLVVRNYLCKLGEIDLVMRDKEVWVFVEVRYRKRSAFGGGEETVTRRKQQKLIKTALHFCMRNKLSTYVLCRFDVVAITPAIETNTGILWIQNAFQVE